jgi:hypothetical protein
MSVQNKNLKIKKCKSFHTNGKASINFSRYKFLNIYYHILSFSKWPTNLDLEFVFSFFLKNHYILSHAFGWCSCNYPTILKGFSKTALQNSVTTEFSLEVSEDLTSPVPLHLFLQDYLPLIYRILSPLMQDNMVDLEVELLKGILKFGCLDKWS